MKILPGSSIPKRNPKPVDPVANAQWPTEKSWQSSVEQWFTRKDNPVPWICYHTWDSRKSARGFPDLVCSNATARRTLFAELKTETGEVSLDQILWLLSLAQDEGNDVFLWRPSDGQEVTAFIQATIDLCWYKN